MADIISNDIELLKFCYRKVTGEPDAEILDPNPFSNTYCVGQYREDGEPLWAVAAYGFSRSHHDCKLDIATNVKGLFSRDLFVRMATQVFHDLFLRAKLLRCTAEVRVSNKASIRLVEAWGFSKEGFRPDGAGRPKVEDLYLYGMLKDECRWI